METVRIGSRKYRVKVSLCYSVEYFEQKDSCRKVIYFPISMIVGYTEDFEQLFAIQKVIGEFLSFLIFLLFLKFFSRQSFCHSYSVTI